MKPLFLLSNDDGYFSQGLSALRLALAPIADVVICAPHTEQSGTSHAITLTRPMRLREIAADVFSVDGSPADSVYVALNASDRILSRRPDAVISGINHGLNLGNDVFYSGTVAAAREGALAGLPALALSTEGNADFTEIAQLAVPLIEAWFKAQAGQASLQNVNLPLSGQRIWRSAKLGTRRYAEAVSFRQDPRGAEYLWVGTGEVSHGDESGTDTAEFDAGNIPITALSLDLSLGIQAPSWL